MNTEKLGKISLCNADCMDVLAELPDKAFDLAIVDPPYSKANGSVSRIGGCWAAKYGNKIKVWDIAPPEKYFTELYRVSRNQIIWGANYFPNMRPTRCFVVWEKYIPENFSMAMCEYAWTSFDRNAKIFKCSSLGAKKDPRFHPTQKPVPLYAWLLNNFANKGDKILDTHLGSGSSALACHNLGFEMLGIEIDKEYYEKAKTRLVEHQRQLNLFNKELEV